MRNAKIKYFELIKLSLKLIINMANSDPAFDKKIRDLQSLADRYAKDEVSLFKNNIIYILIIIQSTYKQALEKYEEILVLKQKQNSTTDA